MKKRFLILPVFFIGAAQCSGVKLTPDISPVMAQEANDATVIIEGCGHQPVVGYAYCRMREGEPTEGVITLHAPPARCAAPPCVYFEIFYPNGDPTHGVSVPENQTQVSVKWSELVKRPLFSKEDRGFWPVRMRVSWIDDAGNPRETVSEGEIRMRVLASGYLPLHEIKSDPNYVWKWQDERGSYRMTTAGRAWVGAK